MASTRPLPRSDRPDGRSVDATARIWHQVAASRSQHLSRSTACLTTLHEPWLNPHGVTAPPRSDANAMSVCCQTGRSEDDTTAGREHGQAVIERRLLHAPLVRFGSPL